MKTTLYAKDSKDTVRVWSIWTEDEFLIMRYGVLDGDLITNSEPVPFGLSTRTKQEQIEMRMQSRINKKKDSGYSESYFTALQGKRTNLLGYPRPMNAKFLESPKNTPKDGVFIQHKLNGHRCLIINDSGSIVAYSKGGKLIETIPEILEEFQDIPEGTILDGELYHHGTIIQTISSWVRRRQENTLKLEFVCFDVIQDAPFYDRYLFLKDIKFGKKSRLLNTSFVQGEFNVIPLLKKSLEDGFEGLILRDPTAHYEEGARKKSVLKVKKRTAGNELLLDDEFLVVGVKESADGWAILICETESGVRFNLSAPGNFPEKTNILQNKEKYIGRHVRATFEEYTKDRKPFHAVAEHFREKHEE